MTPEEIVNLIAGLEDPFGSSEPFDSEQTLATLVRECRRATGARSRRVRARVFEHESREFTEAMLRIEDASPEGLREFVREVVDLLWGVGKATGKRNPRTLDFDKEWEVDTIEEVAAALVRRGFFPFPKG